MSHNDKIDWNFRALFEILGTVFIVILIIVLGIHFIVFVFDRIEIEYNQYDKVIEIMESPVTSIDTKNLIAEAMKDKKIVHKEYRDIIKRHYQEANKTGSITLEKVINVETTN